MRTNRSKSCIIHGITTPFLKRSTACLPKINMLKFKFVICVPQQMDPQPPTLAQALNVVLETCREQRKLIWMLTQNTNQEKLVKLSKGCYCCKAYDHPCLQNHLGMGIPTYPHGFGENPQSTPILPSVTSKEANKHPMEIPAQVNKAFDMDLSNWDITCTEFHPRNIPVNPSAQELIQHFLLPWSQ